MFYTNYLRFKCAHQITFYPFYRALPCSPRAHTGAASQPTAAPSLAAPSMRRTSCPTSPHLECPQTQPLQVPSPPWRSRAHVASRRHRVPPTGSTLSPPSPLTPSAITRSKTTRGRFSKLMRCPAPWPRPSVAAFISPSRRHGFSPLPDLPGLPELAPAAAWDSFPPLLPSPLRAEPSHLLSWPQPLPEPPPPCKACARTWPAPLAPPPARPLAPSPTPCPTDGHRPTPAPSPPLSCVRDARQRNRSAAKRKDPVVRNQTFQGCRCK